MTKFVQFKDVVRAVTMKLAKMHLQAIRDWSDKPPKDEVSDFREVTMALDDSEKIAKELAEAKNFQEILAVLDSLGFRPDEAAEFIFDCIVEGGEKDVDGHKGD